MWTGAEFASRHNHKLTGPIATKAAEQANAILRSGAPEGIAIATANKHADKLLHRANGGATAAALDILRRGRQSGGVAPEIPFFERQEAYGAFRQPYGFSAGAGSGRFDKNSVDLASGSYVIPADVMAGLGEGNSLAGARVVDSMLHSMPYGIMPPRAEGHRGPPPAPHDPQLAQGLFEGTERAPISPQIAKGGHVDETGEKKVPILAADGEYTVHPDDVAKIGAFYWNPRRAPPTWKQALTRGSAILDEFVREERGRNIKEIKALPGPKGSRGPDKGHNKDAKSPEHGR